MYRLFGFGSVPKKLLPVLEQEGVVVLDEGMGALIVTKHVDGPGKRYRQRSEGSSACLAVTSARVVCYTYGKRQINISVEDPMMSKLYVDTSGEHDLCRSFESSDFQEGWRGVIEFRFNTDKALLLSDALVAIGAQQGTAADAAKPRH
jgi:hypothetical protein